MRLYKNGKWMKRQIRSVITDGEGLRELHESIRDVLIKKHGQTENGNRGLNAVDAILKCRVGREGSDRSHPPTGIAPVSFPSPLTHAQRPRLSSHKQVGKICH